MTLDPARISELVARLQRQHDQLKSWRKVAALYPPVVKAGTVNRIAKEGWLPQDRKILKALGLAGQGRQRTQVEKAIAKMARETRKAVLVKK
jgi:hypothetical protein